MHQKSCFSPVLLSTIVQLICRCYGKKHTWTVLLFSLFLCLLSLACGKRFSAPLFVPSSLYFFFFVMHRQYYSLFGTSTAVGLIHPSESLASSTFSFFFDMFLLEKRKNKEQNNAHYVAVCARHVENSSHYVTFDDTSAAASKCVDTCIKMTCFSCLELQSNLINSSKFEIFVWPAVFSKHFKSA